MSWQDTQLLNRRNQASMNQSDAFVSGFFFVWFTVPDKVKDVLTTLFASDKNSLVDANPNDMGRMLSALVTGLPSIPETTLNQTSMAGMGGAKWGVATNIDHPTTVSFKFRELAGLPVCKTIAAWFTLMRDPNSSVSLLIGDDYTKKNWGGEAILAYVKPDGVTVQMATRFEGIHPLKYPSDLFVSDVATVEPMEPDIEFHTDSIWSDPGAFATAQNIIKNFNAAKPFHESGTASLYQGIK